MNTFQYTEVTKMDHEPRFNEFAHILNTIDQCTATINDNVTKEKLKALKNTISFTAPEILSSRLKELFIILKNDCTNNLRCKEIYHNRLQEYFRLLHDDIEINKYKCNRKKEQQEEQCLLFEDNKFDIFLLFCPPC